MPVQKTRTFSQKTFRTEAVVFLPLLLPFIPSLAPTKKPETGRCTFLSVFRLLPVCSLRNNQHQSDFARKADFPSEAQFPRTMAMLTKRINLICGNLPPPDSCQVCLNACLMALDLDVKIRSCTVATCRARVGRETKMGDGDWVLRKRRMDERVWYGMVCTVCTGDNVHQLTGLDWASGQNPHFNDS